MACLEGMGCEQFLEVPKEYYYDGTGEDSTSTLLRDVHPPAFSLHGENQVESMSISIHGAEDAIADVRQLCQVTGWWAIDPTTGEVI